MWQTITDVVLTKEKVRKKAEIKFNERTRAAEKTGGGRTPNDLAEKYFQIMNTVPAVSFERLKGQER